MTKSFCDKCGCEVKTHQQCPFQFRHDDIDICVEAKNVTRWINKDAVICRACMVAIILEGNITTRPIPYDGPGCIGYSYHG